MGMPVIDSIKLGVDMLKGMKEANPQARVVYWGIFALGVLVWAAVIGGGIFIALKIAGVL
ncbi:MAG: hypothetical protein NT130_05820 [Candidatus Micrarchaeota archaeon]|nr:hypothetical protein [Candidatus Micrarchaeota archaeon]